MEDPLGYGAIAVGAPSLAPDHLLSPLVDQLLTDHDVPVLVVRRGRDDRGRAAVGPCPRRGARDRHRQCPRRPGGRVQPEQPSAPRSCSPTCSNPSRHWWPASRRQRRGVAPTTTSPTICSPPPRSSAAASTPAPHARSGGARRSPRRSATRSARPRATSSWWVPRAPSERHLPRSHHRADPRRCDATVVVVLTPRTAA